MNAYIGLDIGTSAVKGVLLYEDGRVIKTVTKGFEYFFKDNAKLLMPNVFIDACFSAIEELAAARDTADIRAICSCCASGSTLFLDKSGTPLTPIIGWQTNISREDHEEFMSKEERAELYALVGWPLGMGFPPSYIYALKKHAPAIFEKTCVIAMAAEYLNFCLTGKWGISQSMATPSYLQIQENGEYNGALIKKLAIEDKKLPPIMKKGSILGNITEKIAERLGLCENCAVVLGSFDHPSGATGAGVYKEGEMLLSCGTSWVEFFPVTSRDFAISTRALVDRFMLDGTPYCVMKSVPSISDKINGLRKSLLGNITHEEFDKLAAISSLGANGLKFSFTDGDAKAAEGYEKCDVARAIIESAAHLLAQNLEKMQELGLRHEKIALIGGITNSEVCTKIIAEVLGQKIHVTNGESAGAVGSAMLAAIGIGRFSSEEDAFEKMNFKTKVFNA